MKLVPKKTHVTNDTSAWLKQEAKKTGQTESVIIAKALEEYKNK